MEEVWHGLPESIARRFLPLAAWTIDERLKAGVRPGLLHVPFRLALDLSRILRKSVHYPTFTFAVTLLPSHDYYTYVAEDYGLTVQRESCMGQRVVMWSSIETSVADSVAECDPYRRWCAIGSYS